jgi:hypothetical protein
MVSNEKLNISGLPDTSVWPGNKPPVEKMGKAVALQGNCQQSINKLKINL